MKNADFCSAGGLKLLENPKYLGKNAFWTILDHFNWVKISFLWNISVFEKVPFMEIQKWQYFWKFWIFSKFLVIKSKKGIFLAGKFAFGLKLDPPQSRIWHFLLSETILVKIYWHFWSFLRFWKFEVLAKKSILGYLLNGIGYFNLGGVYRLPGYILSLVETFLTF